MSDITSKLKDYIFYFNNHCFRVKLSDLHVDGISWMFCQNIELLSGSRRESTHECSPVNFCNLKVILMNTDYYSFFPSITSYLMGLSCDAPLLNRFTSLVCFQIHVKVNDLETEKVFKNGWLLTPR